MDVNPAQFPTASGFRCVRRKLADLTHIDGEETEEVGGVGGAGYMHLHAIAETGRPDKRGRPR